MAKQTKAEKETTKALKFLQSAGDQPVDWKVFATAVGVNGKRLGIIVKGLLDAGAITEPGGEGSLVYVVATK